MKSVLAVLFLIVPTLVFGQTWTPVEIVDDAAVVEADTMDVDGDGYLDVIVSSDANDGTLYWYENQEDVTAGQWAEHTISTLDGFSDIYLVDLDEDGHTDIVYAREDGSTTYIGWVKKSTTSPYWTVNAVDNWDNGDNYADPVQVAAGEINNDTYRDIIVANGSNTVRSVIYWEANSTHTSWTKRDTDLSVGDIHSHVELYVEDFDGGTKDDFFIAGEYGFGGRVEYYQNNGSASFTRTLVDVDIDNFSDVDFYDLDSDGDTDVIGTICENTDGNVLWVEYDAGWTTTNIASIQYLTSIAIGDYDGDSDEDIAAAVSNSTTLHLLTNNGTESFSSSSITAGTTNENVWAFGLFSDDSDVDILVSDAGNTYALDYLMQPSSAPNSIEEPGDFEVVSIDGNYVDLPTTYALLNAYPNPFNSMATIEIALPEASDLNITVTNSIGQTVATLVDGNTPAGYHNFTFDASDLASGLYIFSVKVPGQLEETRKVTLVR